MVNAEVVCVDGVTSTDEKGASIYDHCQYYTVIMIHVQEICFYHVFE